MKCTIRLVIALLLSITAVSARAQGAPPENRLPGAGIVDPIEVAAAAAVSAHMQEALHFLELGKTALKDGDMEHAIPLLTHAIDGNPFDEPRILLADIYIRQGKTDDVIRILKPMIYPPQRFARDPVAHRIRTDLPVQSIGTSDGHRPEQRMKYVLALLDKQEWEEAATVYEQTFAGETARVYGFDIHGLQWRLPWYDGPIHTLPQLHFRADSADYNGLRAQAYLIIGVRGATYAEEGDVAQYALDHLKLALKYDPKSVEANFMTGGILMHLKRYTEGREALLRAARFAPDTSQAEIKGVLKELNDREARQKAGDAARLAAKAQQP